MIDVDKIKIVDDFIQKELRMRLLNTVFFRLDDGSYEIFNDYIIKKENDRYKVVTSTDVKYFNLLKNAVTWCVLNRRNKIGEMLILEELDLRLIGIEFALKQHARLFKMSKSMEDKELFVSKMYEDKLKRQSIMDELDRLVKECKEWQLKKFAKPKY